MNKMFFRFFLFSAFGILLLQCQSEQKKETELPSSSTPQMVTLAPELGLTLGALKNRGRQLDSLYALIDEGTLKEDEVADDLVNEIYDRMSGGWGDSNFPDSIYATSVLAPQGQYTYAATNAHDFDDQTAWVEGKEDAGIGESISFYFRKFEEEEPLTSITVYNGYQRDQKSWEQNTRVKQLKMYVNNIPVAFLNLKDTMEGQKFRIQVDPQGEQSIRIRFEIVDVYPGSKWQDTAITQITFDGIWQGI